MQGPEKEIIAAYVEPGQVRLVYWPMLDLGPNSENAAVAAFCAGEQDASAFWHYHDALFENQRSVYLAGRDFFVDLATTLELDSAAFELCYNGDEVRTVVQNLDQLRRDQGIRVRPTFIIAATADGDGELVLGNQSFEVYDQVIQAQLP